MTTAAVGRRGEADRRGDVFGQAGGFLSFELPAMGAWFTRMVVCVAIDYGPAASSVSSARHASPKEPVWSSGAAWTSSRPA